MSKPEEQSPFDVDPPKERSQPVSSPEPLEPAEPDASQMGVEEFRRFQVRTMPPGVRAKWMSAEVPDEAGAPLVDTVPPNEEMVHDVPPAKPYVAPDAPEIGARLDVTILSLRRRRQIASRRAVGAIVVLLAVFVALLVLRSRNSANGAPAIAETERAPTAEPAPPAPAREEAAPEPPVVTAPPSEPVPAPSPAEVAPEPAPSPTPPAARQSPPERALAAPRVPAPASKPPRPPAAATTARPSKPAPTAPSPGLDTKTPFF
jgi:hypothetical protein